MSRFPFEVIPGQSVMRRDWRDHPLIGFGLRPGSSSKSSFTHWEAYLVLQDYAETDVHELPNISRVWSWEPKYARWFIRNLATYRLISADFAAVLAQATRTPRAQRSAVPMATREGVWAKTAGRCVYCGCFLTRAAGQPNSFHADHVLPVVAGGSNDPANLIPSCASCNLAKGPQTFVEFMKSRGVVE